jgi:hypothetical protein
MNRYCQSPWQYRSNIAKKITAPYKRNKVKVNMQAISSNLQQYGSNIAKKITDLYKRNKVKVNMLAISSNIQQYGSNLGPRKLPTPIEGTRSKSICQQYLAIPLKFGNMGAI